MLGQEPANGWAEQAGDAPDGAEQAGDAGPLLEGKHVAQDGLVDGQHAACAQTLQEPERDQLLHGLRLATQHRADQEDGDRRQKDGLAAEQVGQFAVDRHGDRACQQVGAEDPRVQLNAADLADDRRHRGRDDRSVKGNQERRDKQCQGDQPAVRHTSCSRYQASGFSLSLWERAGVRVAYRPLTRRRRSEDWRARGARR